MSDEPVICNLVCVSKGPLLSSIPERAWTRLWSWGLCVCVRWAQILVGGVFTDWDRTWEMGGQGQTQKLALGTLFVERACGLRKWDMEPS